MSQRPQNSLIADATSAWAAWRSLPDPDRLRTGAAAGWVLLITLAFLQPLIRLGIHALQSDLHSYIPLVPFIAGYLLYSRRHSFPAAGKSSIIGGGGAGRGAVGVLFVCVG